MELLQRLGSEWSVFENRLLSMHALIQPIVRLHFDSRKRKAKSQGGRPFSKHDVKRVLNESSNAISNLAESSAKPSHNI